MAFAAIKTFLSVLKVTKVSVLKFVKKLRQSPWKIDEMNAKNAIVKKKKVLLLNSVSVRSTSLIRKLVKKVVQKEKNKQYNPFDPLMRN